MMALVDRALRTTRISRAAGTSAAFSERGRDNPTSRSSMSKLRCASAPRARIFPWLLILGAAHFLARRFDKAVPKLLLAIQEEPSFPEPYRYLAACYAHMGRLDNAREIVRRLRATTTVVIPDASFLRNAEHRELLLSGLRLAARRRDMSQTRRFAAIRVSLEQPFETGS
jgi:Flp pilus assembly protein TadD